MRKVIIGLSLFCIGGLYAQQTNVYTDIQRYFNEGKVLHAQKKYAASSNSLEKYLELSDKPLSETVQETMYLLAANAYELRNDNAYYMLKAYMDDYSYTSFYDQTAFMLGTLTYEQRNFKEAKLWFAKVNESKLLGNARYDYEFRYAYTLLQLKDYPNSRYYFGKLIGQHTKYESAANYYYAYTEYTQKHYEKALAGFLKVKDDPEYKDFVPYYIVQIYYQQKKYDELMPLAEDLLKKNPNNENNLEIYRILGECYYQRKDYKKTIEYLSKYQAKAPKVVRNEMYLLGISYYNEGDCDNAVKSLSKTTTEDDEMSQNAFLHLGMCYLKMNEKAQARMAFERASLMDYDKTIQEEALYNYALATYELSFSPFNESVKAFEKFLEKYPDSKRTDEVYNYLVSVYLTTNNYEAAYQSIEKIKRPSPKIYEAKQRVLYNMGINSFVAGKYEAAADKFTQSLAYASYDPKTAAQARYWRADCYYKQAKYAQCRTDYEAFLMSAGARSTKEFNLAYYNIGYAYFNEKKYESALSSFLKYLNIESNHKKATYIDAENRVGDCYFINREFASAQKYYTQAADTKQPGTDYSVFQQAFVKGLQKDYNGKISTLLQLTENFPKSEYCDDAMYEIGHSYMMLENYEKAREAYTKLYDAYPTSSLARKGMLQKGMLYYNQNRYEEAIETYKLVVSHYPNSEEAATAIESLEKCYVQTNNLDAYTAYMKKIGRQENVTAEREDSLYYTVAERQYLMGNLLDAAQSFKTYLNKFPNGVYAQKAAFSMADCYYATNNRTEAKKVYMSMAQSPSPYEKIIVSRLAEICYDEKNYGEALLYFKKLKLMSEEYEDLLAARLGVLRCSAFLDDNVQVISIADEMITDPRIDVEVAREVRYRRAKAYIALDDQASAVPDLAELSYETRHAYGAESNYLLANYYFMNGDSEKAEKIIFDFIDKNTPYPYWLARCFVLLSDIYLSRNDDFQAKQYLLSLKENYTQDESIQEMISVRLNEIEMREKKSIIIDVTDENENIQQENEEL